MAYAQVTPHENPSRRQKLELLRAQLDTEWQSFRPVYKDLADNILPSRPKFFIQDHNKGDRRNQRIYDTTATFAARTLSAGMSGGVTDPSREWFSILTPVPELNELPHVKHWLHTVHSRMTWVFLNSNLYQTLPVMYGTMGVFGTSAMLVEKGEDSAIHCTILPLGTYRLAADQKGRVNVCVRELRMTVQQVVDEFGERDANGNIDWSNISHHVQSLYKTGARNSWVDVVHVICPNDDYDERRPEAKYKKFLSCYYEIGGEADRSQTFHPDQNKYLREDGYDIFPVLAGRWSVNGSDVYSTEFPGLDALGDIKQLMKREQRIGEAEDKVNRPPTVGPTHLLNRGASLIPGGFTADDSRGGEGLRSVYQIDPQLQHMEQKQELKRQAINRAFYVDLFLAIQSTYQQGRTATEVEKIDQEKLLLLSEVFQRISFDILDPLIDLTFFYMEQEGLIPEAPEELQGMALKVEYSSIMAQAQKLQKVGALDRWFAFVQAAAAVEPSILAKANLRAWVSEVTEALGVSPELIRPDDEADAILEAQAQAQAEAQQAEQLNQASQAARNLSQSQTSGDNALADVVNAMRGGPALNMIPGGAA